MNPNAVSARGGNAICQQGCGKAVVITAGGASGLRQRCVIPRVLTHIINDRVGAFCSVTLRVAPPDFSKVWYFEREHLRAVVRIDVVKEIVQIQLVRYFTHYAVEHQEAVNSAPEKHAVVVNYAVGRHDRSVCCDRVKLKYSSATCEINANHSVVSPEQPCWR